MFWPQEVDPQVPVWRNPHALQIKVFVSMHYQLIGNPSHPAKSKQMVNKLVLLRTNMPPRIDVLLGCLVEYGLFVNVDIAGHQMV